MPLKRGSSDETISENIKTLMHERPTKSRKKAIHTIAVKEHISERKAKQQQAIAIAYTKAGRSKKK